MRAGISVQNLHYCPDFRGLGNLEDKKASPNFHRIVRNGSYFRRSDGKKISRFLCLSCKKSFSKESFSDCYYQKKRELNSKVDELFCSGVSQRRIAYLLKINLKTVARKLVFLGSKAQRNQNSYLESLHFSQGNFNAIEFDEMETFERSKCLPLSIALAVEMKTRKILGFRVSVMPAKGPLAAISRRKYGLRRDDRSDGAYSLFKELVPFIDPKVEISTDQNPKYPSWIKAHFPKAIHYAYKGRRGCIVGQGELKKIGFDPLFDLNHTCAMFRANVNRLFRRTWCTTKRVDRLECHLALYVQFHNRVLTA